MRILMIVQFFPPEIGASPLRNMGHVRFWKERGHHVTVVTNAPNSPFGKFYPGYRNKLFQEEVVEGVEIRRMLTLPSGKKHHKLHRLMSFIVNLVMSIFGGCMGKRPDVVIAVAPYFTGIAGLIASCRHRAPLVYEMQDPWIQVHAESGRLKREGGAYKILRGVEKCIAKYARRVVVVSREMARYIHKEYHLREEPGVVYNANSSDAIRTTGGCMAPVKLDEAKGRFVIGIIGNMGSQYDFDVVLDAAQDLSPERCLFMFMGEGVQKKRIQAEVVRRKLANATFYDPVPAKEMAGWFRRCDLTLVSMKPQSIFRVYVSIKALDSLLFDIPVLFGGQGEMADILAACGGGEIFAPGDKETLVSLICKYMNREKGSASIGAKQSDFVDRCFSRKSTAAKYLELLRASGSSR